MTKETKNKIKELHAQLSKEYGKDFDFELAMSPKSIYFVSLLPSGKFDELDSDGRFKNGSDDFGIKKKAKS